MHRCISTSGWPWWGQERSLRSAAELAQIVKELYLIAPSHGELDTYLGRKLMAADHVTC